MNEQIQAREPRQRRTVGPTIFMIAGIIFLATSLFIQLRGSYISTPGYSNSSVPGPLEALDALSIPSIPIGVMLFLIGLVNTTKKPSLRQLRSTVSILCGSLLGLAVLWFLFLLFLILQK